MAGRERIVCAKAQRWVRPRCFKKMGSLLGRFPERRSWCHLPPNTFMLCPHGPCVIGQGLCSERGGVDRGHWPCFLEGHLSGRQGCKIKQAPEVCGNRLIYSLSLVPWLRPGLRTLAFLQFRSESLLFLVGPPPWDAWSTSPQVIGEDVCRCCSLSPGSKKCPV